MAKNKKNKKNKIINILFYYSVILSSILFVGGVLSIKSTKELISNILFLPVVVYLFITLYLKKKS